jgi:hypothetical protein
MKLRTPLKAIRAKCIDCSGYDLKKVRDCRHDDCSFHPVRMGKGSRSTMKRIRSYCLWCSGSKEGVRLCPSTKCPLWEYRFGRRPKKSLLWPEMLTTEAVLKIEMARQG